jgi:hypothetical protein
MALIKQHREFQSRLNGFTEVGFDVFRNKLLPLRRKVSGWTEDEREYIRGLAADGAAYALQRLFGAKHPEAVQLLGATLLDPDPMTRKELIEHLNNLFRSCRTAGWTAERFGSFALYLDSDLSPTQLVERHREARREKALEASLFSQSKAAPLTPDDWEDGEPAPERDSFADSYRGASAAYKRCVQEQFAATARTAPTNAEVAAADAASVQRLLGAGAEARRRDKDKSL